MVYMGSKNRIAKYILPFLQEHLNGENYFVDAFCGGCNLIDKLDYPKRIANDSNEYLIAMFEYLQKGGTFDPIDKDGYIRIRDNKGDYPASLVGFVGFCCSVNGKWFNGYSGNNTVVSSGIRHYQNEKIRGLNKQISLLNGVVFINKGYETLTLPSNSVIYCDPPYQGTTGYKDSFDHDKFWQWCRDMTAKGHKVFVSEYNAPEDFKCVWEMEVTNSLNTKKTHKPIEKLFTL